MENKKKCDCDCQCDSPKEEGKVVLISGHREGRSDIGKAERLRMLAEAQELDNSKTSTTFFERLKAKIMYKLRAHD